MKYMYVYILKCNDNSYYTGVTNDIDRRLEEHNSGESPKAYTYKRRQLTLVFGEYFLDPEQAIEFEKQIKGWSRKKKEALIEENWEKLKEFAVCINNTSHTLYKKTNVD